MKEEDYKDKKRLVIILLIIEIIIILLLLAYCNAQKVEAVPSKVALIEEISEPLYEPEYPGQIAIRVNDSVQINGDVMKNINLYNSNKDVLMQGTIKHNDIEIYKSDYIKPGEMVKNDYIDASNLDYGENEALMEICFYNEKNELVGQSNVIMTLHVI